MFDRKLLLGTAGLLSWLITCATLAGTSVRSDDGCDQARRVRRPVPCGDAPVVGSAVHDRGAHRDDGGRPTDRRRRASLDVASRPLAKPDSAATSAVRELETLVLDRAGRPVAGVAVRLERFGASGVWLGGARARSDGNGRARLRGFETGALHRVAAEFPGAGSPIETRSLAPVTLSVDRPRRAVIELRSRLGHPLSGARRVEVETVQAGGSGPTYRSLEPGDAPAQWIATVADRIEATVHVTDSLGRAWRDEVVLIPGGTSVAAPGPEWIAIARTEIPGGRRGELAGPGRLRWSLRVGDRATRRGSGPLARDGAFHAVVGRDTSREHGGTLELRWTAHEVERSVGAAWHPDPTLEHIALNASPIGEVVPFPSSHFQRP